MTFGEKIRESRIALKMTQKQLADKIGAKHNSISDWENDKNKPDPNTIELLCGVLNISPNYLLNSNSDDFSLYEKEIIKKYRALDSHGKEMFDFTLSKEYDRSIAERKKQIEEYKEWGKQLHKGNLKLFNEVFSSSHVSEDKIVYEMGPETDEWSYQLEQFRNNNVAYINSYTNLHTKAMLQKIVDEERAELNAAHERTDITPSAEDVQHDNATMDDSDF